MRPNFDTPVCKPHLRTVLLSALALGGVLASTTGCPAKAACPPCYVGGVMADSGTTNAAPSSAVHLQLDSRYSNEKLSEVKVILTDASGGSETLTYSGEKIKAINTTSLTSIADNELYSIDGKPPETAEVEFKFSSGKSTGPITISVKPETATATTATTPTP
jgi:hypothetical protein